MHPIIFLMVPGGMLLSIIINSLFLNWGSRLVMVVISGFRSGSPSLVMGVGTQIMYVAVSGGICEILS